MSVSGSIRDGAVLGFYPVERKDLPAPPFGQYDIVTDRCEAPDQGGEQDAGRLAAAAAGGVTFRINCKVRADTPFIRLVWFNLPVPTQGSPPNPAAFTLNASIDYIPVGQNINDTVPIPIQFNGAVSVNVALNGHAISDPIYGPFFAGDLILVRSCVVTSAGTNTYPIGQILTRTYEGYLAGDQTAAPNFSTSFTTGILGYHPSLILGCSPNAVTWSGQGDSIMQGADDSGSWPGTGAYQRMCGLAADATGYPRVRVGQAGEGVTQITLPAGKNTSGNWFRTRGLASLMASNLYCAYGVNDIFTLGASLATLQAAWLLEWGAGYMGGQAVWQQTILPDTTSTDSWATYANQSLRAQESIRVAANAWLRDGAPILNGVAVATGSSAAGTLRAGMLGHPLMGIFDAAAAVEQGGASAPTGKWLVDGTANKYTDDGVHPSTFATLAIVTQLDSEGGAARGLTRSQMAARLGAFVP